MSITTRIERSVSISKTQEFIQTSGISELNVALTSSKIEHNMLLGALIFSLGYSNVTVDTREDISEYSGSDLSGTTNILLVLSKEPLTLTGKLAKLMPKVFKFVIEVEGPLSSAVYYSPSMQEDRLSSSISVAGIDKSIAHQILKLWHR